MNNLFLALILISLLGLLIGFIKPSVVKINSRKNVLLIFGLSFVLFFILFGATLGPSSSMQKESLQARTTAQREDVSTPQQNSGQTQGSSVTQHAPVQTQAQTQNPSVAQPIQAVTTTSASSETISQKNAVVKAKDYLSYSAFSHDGLVNQLEFEQFSPADALYGADNCGANWDEEAAKKAKDYMSYSVFSRGSLINQLEYDKFTPEQAEYGASAVGL
jgi:hypothetical protein